MLIMKKVIFGTALASMALLSACSSDNELANVGTTANNAIGFHVVGNKAETRANIVDNNNINGTDFNVYAFTKDGKAFMGTSDTEFAWNGTNIKNKDGKWDYANESDLRYWPEITTPLDFYAVNPSTFETEMQMNFSWNMTSSSQKIYYATVDEYGNKKGHTNYDVMYAIAKDQTKETKSGKVALTFKHILSQIAFKAKTKEADMKVEIKGMKIHNFQIGGTFTFPADANIAATREANWTPNGKNAPAFTIAVKNKTTVDSKDKATEIFTEPILFVPQKLIPWATTASSPMTKEDADIAKQSYLEVNCKIWKDGHLIFGAESEVKDLTDNEGYKTLYVPFGTSWEPGKRHIYTLIFGGGYDDQGNQFLMPINFEATVENWKDVTSSDNNIDM